MLVALPLPKLRFLVYGLICSLFGKFVTQKNREWYRFKRGDKHYWRIRNKKDD